MTDAMVIRKTTVLNAPQARVWAAISESERFGRWFGMTLDGPFIAGQRVSGRITPTTVDAEVARLQAPHAGTPCLLFIEAIEPMTRVAFRWQPGAPPPSADVEGAERAGSAGSPGSPGSPGPRNATGAALLGRRGSPNGENCSQNDRSYITLSVFFSTETQDICGYKNHVFLNTCFFTSDVRYILLSFYLIN